MKKQLLQVILAILFMLPMSPATGKAPTETDRPTFHSDDLPDTLQMMDDLWRPVRDLAHTATSLDLLPPSSSLLFYAQTNCNQATLDKLYSEAQTARQDWRFDDARTLYEDALKVAVCLKQRGYEAFIRYFLGDIYNTLGDKEKALESSLAALPLIRDMGNQQKIELLDLEQIYEYALQLSQYSLAAVYVGQALDLAYKMGNIESQLNAGDASGYTMVRLGRYRKALEFYDWTLKLAQSQRDWSFEYRCLIGYGNVYLAWSRLTDAETYYQQAYDLSTANKTFLEDKEADALGKLALVYHRRAQYARALELYKQALELTAISSDDTYIVLYGNMALVYHRLGQIPTALEYYQKSLDLAQKADRRANAVTNLQNMGVAYLDLDQYDRARDLLNQALTFAREIGDHTLEAQALNNIGVSYSRQEQYDEALDYHQQSLKVSQDAGNRDDEAIALYNIARTQKLQGDFEPALDYTNQVLKINRETGNLRGEVLTLNLRGHIYDDMHQPDNAIKEYRLAVDAINEVLIYAALDSAVAGLSAQNSFREPFRRLVMLLGEQGKAAEALQYAEAGQALLARLDIVGGSINFRAGLDDALLTREKELLASITSAQAALSALRRDTSAKPADIQTTQKALDGLRNDYRQQLETMQLQGGFTARQLANKTTTLEEIRAALPDDTTLVSVALSEGYKSAMVLCSADTLEVVVLDATRQQVNEQVDLFMSDRSANAESALRKLYDLIFAPLEGKLTTKHLMIAPDGPLNYIPFAALKSPDGSYLIDHYAISMIPSGSTLVLLQDRKAAKPNSPGLVLAQPAAPGLARLQNARDEANKVAEVLGVKANLNATESDLRANVAGGKILHISAHAELDRFAPLFSTIYLKDDAKYDGRVEMREIYELDLSRGNELVILSGCNTASGGDGEDFGVLTRAFFGAGAPRVVASLWSVDDEATALLISTFVAERANYANNADALQSAMLVARAKYPDPYYWASFVLSGVPAS